jgi:signal transduction histidine kinase
MKRLLFLFALLCVFYSEKINAQDVQDAINSTKLKLKTAKTTTEKARLNSDLAWYYSRVSVDSAKIYGFEALKLSKQTKNDTLIGMAYNDLSTVFTVDGKYKKALDYARTALKYRIKIKDDKGIASAYFKIGNSYNKMNVMDSTMINYLKAKKYFEKTGDSLNIVNVESNISVTYYFSKNYAKALERLKLPLSYFKRNEKFVELSNSLISLGNIKLKQKDTTEAINSYLEAEKIAKSSNNMIGLASIYNNLSTIYTDLDELKKGADYSEKSINLRKQLGATGDINSSLLTLAITEFKIGKTKQAKDKLKKLVNEFSTTDEKDKLREAYLSLSFIYAAENNIDSLELASQKFNLINEEFASETNLKYAQEIEVKYQTEKKEKEILKQRTKLAEQKNYIIIAISLVLLAIFIGYLIYTAQRNKNKQLKKEQELSLALSQIETQNKLQNQRLEISRDLHDTIGSQLTFIISSIDNLKYGFKDASSKVSNKLNYISDFTKDTIYELRDTIWAMNKDEITVEDLNSRISNFITNANLATEHIDFSFNSNLSEEHKTSFGSKTGMNIYRIIQEAVNNAIKHSNATKIEVNVNAKTNNIAIIIKDNGKGFKTETVEAGNGLQSMRKRAEELEAKLEITSKQTGTLVTVYLTQ